MDAYIGEIRPFAFSYIPYGWLGCYGNIVNIQQYQALYTLVSNVYGGSYQQGTFALPNLQGYAPIGVGQGPGLTLRQFGKVYGTTSEALNYSQSAMHTHSPCVVQPKNSNLTANGQQAPVANTSWLCQLGNVPDATHFRSSKAYFPAAAAPTLDSVFIPGTIGSACGNSNGSVTPHSNVQPYLPLVMCICWNGVYPDFN